MPLSLLDVCNTCRHFGLSTHQNQRTRVARAYTLWHRGAVRKAPNQTHSYETWCVDSQYDRGTYTVRVFTYPTDINTTCDCPDFRRGYASTGLHAGPLCKHCVAVLMERKRQELIAAITWPDSQSAARACTGRPMCLPSPQPTTGAQRP